MLLQVDLVPEVLVVGLDWKTQVTEEAGVYYVIGQTVHHRKNVVMSLGSPDCLGVIGKASVIRLALGIPGKIGVVVVTELNLFVMGLIGKLRAIRLTQWSLRVRL